MPAQTTSPAYLRELGGALPIRLSMIAVWPRTAGIRGALSAVHARASR